MEPDMASAMLYRMKEDGCEVQTIHADNDSTTACRSTKKWLSIPSKKAGQESSEKELDKTAV